MNLYTVRQAIHNRHENDETYQSIADDLGITKAMAWQIEHGYKPGRRVSAILQLDPCPDLRYTRTRRERLDEIARGWGYSGWCNYESSLLHADNKVQ